MQLGPRTAAGLDFIGLRACLLGLWGGPVPVVLYTGLRVLRVSELIAFGKTPGHRKEGIPPPPPPRTLWGQGTSQSILHR